MHTAISALISASWIEGKVVFKAAAISLPPDVVSFVVALDSNNKKSYHSTQLSYKLTPRLKVLW